MNALELSRATLEFMDLDATVEFRDLGRALDGTVLMSARPRITLAAHLADNPGLAIATVLHEAAHVLSGDKTHGPAFEQQWKNLTDELFLANLARHLDVLLGETRVG